MFRSTTVRLAILVLCLGVMASSWAQSQEANNSEREGMYSRYLNFAALVKGGSIQPHWMSDRNAFWYAEGPPDSMVIYKVDPKGNAKERLFNTERLRQALTPLLGYEPPYKGLPFKEFTFVDGEKAVKFTAEGREFICPLDTYKITAVPVMSEEERSRMIPQRVRKGSSAGAPDVMEVLSPDRRWFVGEKDHNLWLRSTYDGRSEPLTTDGTEDYEWDTEMGVAWSPDGLKIAATKMDNRKVLHLPIVHWLKTTEEVEWVHFTKAGGPMPRAELYILDVISRKQVRVEAGNDPDLSPIPRLHQPRTPSLGHEPPLESMILGWRPDGSELLFLRADREYKKVDLIAANPRTGSIRVILTETAKTFIGEETPYFFLEDGKRLIWRSERNGWAHLYLYDMQGNLLKQLTNGSFPVVGVAAADEKAGWIYFTGHAEKQPYDTHLYRVNFEGQGLTRLTESAGQHQIQFSPSKEFFLDTHSNMDRPPVVELRKSDGTLLQAVLKANIDALKELKWSPPEEFIVKAADGKTDLYGALFKPYDFDPQKKYPVIDYIYNGPQTTVVPRSFTGSSGTLPRAVAQLGFVVLVVDGRGTPERGKEFQDVVYRNFGRNEIPDHVATIKELAGKRPYMDLSRVGIFGGSWGGYMTVRAMVLAPDVYKVGISIYPVVDLIDHWAYIERWMGLPQNNKEGYEYGSSLRLAGQLKGKLLLIHGTSDVNAHFSATMKMAEALIRAGKPFDLIVMPEQDHALKGAGQRYLFDALRRYFQEHLKP